MANVKISGFWVYIKANEFNCDVDYHKKDVENPKIGAAKYDKSNKLKEMTGNDKQV